jgi:hypothetical protein
MGRFWGAGGWIGPRSRLENWAYRRWWRFPFVVAITGWIVWFPVLYFGLVSDRSKHQFLPSLVGAAIYGILVALILLFLDWLGLIVVGRRDADRDAR